MFGQVVKVEGRLAFKTGRLVAEGTVGTATKTLVIYIESINCTVLVVVGNKGGFFHTIIEGG